MHCAMLQKATATSGDANSSRHATLQPRQRTRPRQQHAPISPLCRVRCKCRADRGSGRRPAPSASNRIRRSEHALPAPGHSGRTAAPRHDPAPQLAGILLPSVECRSPRWQRQQARPQDAEVRYLSGGGMRAANAAPSFIAQRVRQCESRRTGNVRNRTSLPAAVLIGRRAEVVHDVHGSRPRRARAPADRNAARQRRVQVGAQGPAGMPSQRASASACRDAFVAWARSPRHIAIRPPCHWPRRATVTAPSPVRCMTPATKRVMGSRIAAARRTNGRRKTLLPEALLRGPARASRARTCTAVHARDVASVIASQTRSARTSTRVSNGPFVRHRFQQAPRFRPTLPAPSSAMASRTCARGAPPSHRRRVQIQRGHAHGIAHRMPAHRAHAVRREPWPGRRHARRSGGNCSISRCTDSVAPGCKQSSGGLFERGLRTIPVTRAQQVRQATVGSGSIRGATQQLRQGFRCSRPRRSSGNREEVVQLQGRPRDPRRPTRTGRAARSRRAAGAARGLPATAQARDRQSRSTNTEQELAQLRRHLIEHFGREEVEQVPVHRPRSHRRTALPGLCRV